MKKLLCTFLIISISCCLFSGCESLVEPTTYTIYTETTNNDDYDDGYDDDSYEVYENDSYNDDSGYNYDYEEDNNNSYIPDYQDTHTHYYSYEVTTKATCAKEGVKTFTCSCGDSYTETISKDTWHDWEYATCTKPKTCNVCGKTEGSAKGHTYYSDGKCSCGATNPIVTSTLEKCSLTVPSLPKSVSYYSYNNKLYSTVSVTNVTYKFECDNDGDIELEIYFSGKKTYDYRGSGQSDTCKIGWKLYGPDGSVIKTDTFYSPSVTVGETFTNKSEQALYSWDEGSAGAYRLEILDVN